MVVDTLGFDFVVVGKNKVGNGALSGILTNLWFGRQTMNCVATLVLPKCSESKATMVSTIGSPLIVASQKQQKKMH